MAAVYPTPAVDIGAYVQELILFTPESQMCYNAAGDLIKIVKKTANGATFERQILDKDVTDYEVAKVDVYTRWTQTR